jgi:DsbC/DsbD-like thiol-disulfide interchange protein
VRARLPLTLACLALASACSQKDADAPAAPAQKDTPPAAGTGEVPAEEDDHENLVQVEALLAGENELAVRYTIKPGWHLYWINPGDSGLKTDAELKAPEGFTFGPWRYPTPEAFTSPGDITSYGYEHEVVLFSTFEMSDPPPEQSKIEVAASWLACKSSCIKGKADTTIEIATAHPADDTLLIEHRQKLPRPGTELGATTGWTTADDGPVLEANLPEGKVVDFFPLRTDPAMLEKSTVEANRLQLHYKVNPAKLPEVSGPQGVVVVEQADGSRGYFHLEAPWPTA